MRFVNYTHLWDTAFHCLEPTFALYYKYTLSNQKEKRKTKNKKTKPTHNSLNASFPGS